MDPRLEQLLGHAKAAREARAEEQGERSPREGGLDKFGADVRNRGRRATDHLRHSPEGLLEHAKDFSHRRT